MKEITGQDCEMVSGGFLDGTFKGGVAGGAIAIGTAIGSDDEVSLDHFLLSVAAGAITGTLIAHSDGPMRAVELGFIGGMAIGVIDRDS